VRALLGRHFCDEAPSKSPLFRNGLSHTDTPHPRPEAPFSRYTSSRSRTRHFLLRGVLLPSEFSAMYRRALPSCPSPNHKTHATLSPPQPSKSIPNFHVPLGFAFVSTAAVPPFFPSLTPLQYTSSQGRASQYTFSPINGNLPLFNHPPGKSP